MESKDTTHIVGDGRKGHGLCGDCVIQWRCLFHFPPKRQSTEISHHGLESLVFFTNKSKRVNNDHDCSSYDLCSSPLPHVFNREIEVAHVRHDYRLRQRHVCVCMSCVYVSNDLLVRVCYVRADCVCSWFWSKWKKRKTKLCIILNPAGGNLFWWMTHFLGVHTSWMNRPHGPC